MSYNGAWWFVLTYIWLVLLYPIMKWFGDKLPPMILICISGILYVVFYYFEIIHTLNISNFIIAWIWHQLCLIGRSQFAFILGIIWCKYSVMDKIRNFDMNVKMKNLCLLVCVAVTFIFHCFIPVSYTHLDVYKRQEYKGIKILTVGRLYREKGQDIIPEVARQLKREGYDFKWYLIGEGSIRKEIEKKIEEYELKDTVILLGTKTNPYRFYKDATIYVQTSRHEGFGITIAEAKVFKLPIVSTDVAGAREQLKEKNEIIVQFAPEELAKGIKKLLEKLRG